MNLYGLLYVNDQPENHANVGGTSIAPYVRCASLCQRSAQLAGHHFTVVTNNIDAVKSIARDAQLELRVTGMQFNSPYPRSLRFYSAHFKLDLIRAFGQGMFGKVVGLIDLDTVFVRPLPSAVVAGEPHAYDISTAIMPVYGPEKVREDLNRVSGRTLEHHQWYGGEFITGTMEFMASLSEKIDEILPRYLNLASELHHQGDEMIVSAALNSLSEGPLDAGGDAVSRWWSARTSHRQQPFSIAEKASLLHLPSDKEFLGHRAEFDFRSDEFLEAYRGFAAKKLRTRRLAGLVDVVRGRPRKFVASL